MTAAETASPTLHGRIRADLEAKILSGEWPPGHRIPPEQALTAHYACARMTVNKVLSSLAGAGLIDRRRRAGSFVAQPHIQSAVLQIPDIATEVEARGERYGYEMLRRRLLPARGNRGGTGTVDPEPMLSIACRHLANGQPFALEDRTISLATVPDAADADFSIVPPGSWLLQHVPWTEAEHRISAIGAAREHAEALAVARGAACLCLERRTWRSGALVTAVRQIFRGDRYHLMARFSPQGER